MPGIPTVARVPRVLTLRVAPRRPILSDEDFFPRFHRIPGAMRMLRRKRNPITADSIAKGGFSQEECHRARAGKRLHIVEPLNVRIPPFPTHNLEVGSANSPNGGLGAECPRPLVSR